MKVSHYKILDGVRALAAIMVMIFHFFQNIQHDNPLFDSIKTITAFGRTGVTLFFILSGFLITRILLNSREKENYFKSFFTNRALRIFPLYYFFLIIYYFLVPYITDEPFVAFEKQWSYWFFFQNFTASLNQPIHGPIHFWSLAIEQNFYFLWPFLVYYLNNKQLYRVIFFIILFSISVRLVLLSLGHGGYYFTLSSVDALIIGSTLALNELKSGFSAKWAKRYLLLLMAFIIPSFIFWFLIDGKGPKIVQVLKFPFINIAYLAFIGFLLVYKEHKFINRIFAFQPLVYIGKISYGLYVYHPLCFYFYFKYFATHNIVFDLFTAFGISFIISSATFHFLESPFLRLKNTFSN